MAKKNVTPPKTFEEGLQELEQILADIESGALGLEDSLGKYERGTFLIEHCRGVLAAAEKQIELLTRAADGSLEGRPLTGAVVAAPASDNE
jgi:exodeoxyribonuclease VII small subunit